MLMLPPLLDNSLNRIINRTTACEGAAGIILNQVQLGCSVMDAAVLLSTGLSSMTAKLTQRDAVKYVPEVN